MAACIATVYVYRGYLIYRAEMQQYAPMVKAGWNIEMPRIPKRLVRMYCAVYAGKLTFGRKRNDYFAVHGFRYCVGRSYRILPYAVQIDIAFAL